MLPLSKKNDNAPISMIRLVYCSLAPFNNVMICRLPYEDSFKMPDIQGLKVKTMVVDDDHVEDITGCVSLKHLFGVEPGWSSDHSYDDLDDMLESVQRELDNPTKGIDLGDL